MYVQKWKLQHFKNNYIISVYVVLSSIYSSVDLVNYKIIVTLPQIEYVSKICKPR